MSFQLQRGSCNAQPGRPSPGTRPSSAVALSGFNGHEDCQLSALFSTWVLRAYGAEQFFAGREVLSVIVGCLAAPLTSIHQKSVAPQAVTTNNVFKHCQLSHRWQNPQSSHPAENQ